MNYTRYSDRVLINNKRTRTLLTKFTQRSITSVEVAELKGLIDKHATFLTKLIHHLIPDEKCEDNDIKCPLEWNKFIHCLAAGSAVCALIHPSEQQLLELLQSIEKHKEDLTNLNVESLHCLQQQFPILFELVHSLKSRTYEYNVLQQMLCPIIHELLQRATAPFTNSETAADPDVIEHEHTTVTVETDNIAYFPCLPILRNRGAYLTDNTSTNKVCTKRRIGHPTLLPGIFTLFCDHGMCNDCNSASMHIMLFSKRACAILLYYYLYHFVIL